MEIFMNSVTRFHATRLLLIISSVLYTSASEELLIGFKATPSPSISSFQALLNDPTSIFSLGFLRVNRTQLALSVIHLPSLQPLWQADPTAPFPWSAKTNLFFNGSLVICDLHSGLFWSTGTQGDKVVLLNSSNLQVLQQGAKPLVVWQSFNFPTDTLVENQNFSSDMSLVSSNGLYSMRLGNNFMGLYAKFRENSHLKDQIYWKHKALEAKAKVIEGQGPIYARVNSDGFLGMYQTGNTPVDMQTFNTFQRPTDRFLLIRIEPDGNLKGYSWTNETNWVLEFQAIRDTCELPSPCGSYGLCTPGSGCSCLDNQTEFRHGSCFDGHLGELCSDPGDDFWVLRRKGVELPFKELMGSKTASSLEQCEGFCENNCSCWGTLYNNVTGFCYFVDYPIQTLVGGDDDSKVGYFKVRKGREKKMKLGFGIGIGFLCGAILILIGAIGFGSYKIWKRRGARRVLEEDGGVSPGPYKDLRSASFRSIEMCNK